MAPDRLVTATLKLRLSGSPHHIHSINPRAFVPRRRFHASPQRPFLESCLTGTHALITGIHSATGLPWAATLPLTALLLRVTIIGPLTTYSHSITLQRSALRPLMQAWQHVFRRKVMKDHAALGPVACQEMVTKHYNEKWQEIVKARGVQFWKVLLNWLQLPIFLIVIETIRKMSGVGEGLLGLLMKRFKGTEDVVLDGAVEDGTESTLLSVQQSFANEGALWFPDLLVPDPHLILPFMLSGVLFSNIAFHEMVARKSSSTPTKGQRRIRNILRILALAIGPLTLQVPSAMLVYWISSSLCALGQNAFLEWYMPHPKAVTPCKPRQSQDFADLNPKP